MRKTETLILCAEDNHLDVDLLLLAFNELGIDQRVEIVRDGQEAVDYLLYQGVYTTRPKIVPDAILLDIKMPKLNGIEVLKTVRHLPDLEEVPIIMLTSSEMRQDIEACYALGANAYVVKPIDFDKFLDMVQSIQQFWTLLNKQTKITGVF